MEFSKPEYWSELPFPSPGDLPNPGIECRSPALWADSLPAEPQGKPKNTGVGSLSLLQGNLPTQELNQGLLHCRWILYQPSYEGSPTEQSSHAKDSGDMKFASLPSSKDYITHLDNSELGEIPNKHTSWHIWGPSCI